MYSISLTIYPISLTIYSFSLAIYSFSLYLFRLMLIRRRDVGGHQEVRDTWRDFFVTCDAIVYIVDLW